MKKCVCAIILVLSMLQAVGCGGSGATTNGGGNSSSAAPTSGEYLFQGNSVSSLNLSKIDTSTGAIDASTVVGNDTNEEAIYPGVAVTPSNKFLYALFTSFTLIQGFAISGPGFTLTPLKNTPFVPRSTGPFNSMVLHPTGSFLYVIHSSSTIEEHSVNSTTGDLTFVADVTEPLSDLRMAVIDPSGNFFYATDITGGQIFAYRINPADGTLSAVPGSPFALSAGSQPSIPAISSNGKFLYVSQAAGVAGFAIDSTSGALTPVPGSPFVTSSTPVFLTAFGNFVYVCNSNGSVDGFVADANGTLASIPGSPFLTTPSLAANITFDPSGKFAYVSNPSTSTIYAFSVNAVSGALSPIPGSPFPGISGVENLHIVRIP